MLVVEVHPVIEHLSDQGRQCLLGHISAFVVDLGIITQNDWLVSNAQFFLGLFGNLDLLVRERDKFLQNVVDQH